jgi:hypothetical protein
VVSGLDGLAEDSDQSCAWVFVRNYFLRCLHYIQVVFEVGRFFHQTARLAPSITRKCRAPFQRPFVGAPSLCELKDKVKGAATRSSADRVAGGSAQKARRAFSFSRKRILREKSRSAQGQLEPGARGTPGPCGDSSLSRLAPFRKPSFRQRFVED